jgi:hypothetical protein
LSFLLLLDRRNALKSDRFMDKLSGSVSAGEKAAQTEKGD